MEPMTATTRTAFRTCPLCEAGCGLEIGLAATDGGERVTRIRGDREDVFSHGFICPKGSTLKQLHEDPDWLRRPLVKRDGAFVEVGWDEAFAEVEARLLPIVEEHGPRRRRRLRRQPQRPLAGRPALPAPAHPGAGHHQRVLGQHRRPAAQGDLLGPHVRRAASPCPCPTSTAPTSC